MAAGTARQWVRNGHNPQRAFQWGTRGHAVDGQLCPRDGFTVPRPIWTRTWLRVVSNSITSPHVVGLATLFLFCLSGSLELRCHSFSLRKGVRKMRALCDLHLSCCLGKPCREKLIHCFKSSHDLWLCDTKPVQKFRSEILNPLPNCIFLLLRTELVI